MKTKTPVAHSRTIPYRPGKKTYGGASGALVGGLVGGPVGAVVGALLGTTFGALAEYSPAAPAANRRAHQHTDRIALKHTVKHAARRVRHAAAKAARVHPRAAAHA